MHINFEVDGIYIGTRGPSILMSLGKEGSNISAPSFSHSDETTIISSSETREVHAQSQIWSSLYCTGHVMLAAFKDKYWEGIKY